MPVALIAIGALLIVVAFQNTMGQLARELKVDVPAYFVWIVAIAALLGLGYVPGLKTVSRLLLALVVVVIVLTNYKTILEGFQKFASSGGKPIGGTAPNPSTTGTTPAPAADVSGAAPTGSSSSVSSMATGAAGGLVGGIVGQAGQAIAGAGASGASAVITNFNPMSWLGGLL